MSKKLISMIHNLPRSSERIWIHRNVHNLEKSFRRQRKRIANKLGNPRLFQIPCHTLRQSINSTLLYTQLISFEGDEYDVKVAETKKERIAMLEAGFEWVGEDHNGLTYFRKRK